MEQPEDVHSLGGAAETGVNHLGVVTPTHTLQQLNDKYCMVS